MTCSFAFPSGVEGVTECGCPDIPQAQVPTTTCNTCPFHTSEPAASALPLTKQPIRGAGDLIAAGLSAVGIKKKDGCGCGSRQAKLNRLIPFAGSRVDARWAVAVTTAPRTGNTLPQCVSSLRTAGWEPIIFAEPGSQTIEDAETVTNKTKLGIWHNWLQSARWCVHNTNAAFILTVQDDVTFHPDSKTFTESILWPSSKCGFVSLYTPKHYQIKDGDPDAWQPGIRRVRTGSLWGACALVWPRSVLQEVVDHPIASSWLGVRPKSVGPVPTGRTNDRTNPAGGTGPTSWREQRKADPSLINNSDTAIGRILKALQREFWYVDPSPAQHVARFSTVNHGDNTGRRNCYRCADCTVPLADQVPVTDTFQRFAA